MTRFFNGSPSDILREMLQNARRSGATAISIENDDNGFSITDNGIGIADPSLLLRFGGSGWAEETTGHEQPAGMGFYSLAGRTTTITSRTAGGPGWTTTLEPAHYDSRKAAEISLVGDEGENAAGLPPTGTSIRTEWLDKLNGHTTNENSWFNTDVKNATRFLPVEVQLNGQKVEQEGFNAKACATETWNGVTIGVHRNPNDGAGLSRNICDAARTVNFHGALATHPSLPIIRTLEETYGVRIDAGDSPDLALVLPRRTEIILDEFAALVAREAERAIYRHLRHTAAEVPFNTWTRARELGIDLAIPEIKLHPWKPDTAEETAAWTTSRGERVTPAENAVLIHEMPAPTAQILALRNTATGDTEQIKLLEADRRYKGYPAYDGLPEVLTIRTTYRTTVNGDIKATTEYPVDWTAIKAAYETGDAPPPNAETPDITVEIEISGTNGAEKRVIGWPVSVAFTRDFEDDPGAPEVQDLLLTPTRRRLTPEILETLLVDAFFEPPESGDRDTARDNYRLTMRDIALAVLAPDEERRGKMISDLTARSIAYYTAVGHTATVTVTRQSRDTWKTTVTFTKNAD